MELYPILSQSVLFAAIIASVFKIRGIHLGWLLIVTVVLLIPINQIAIWQYIRAVCGDLSISLSILAIWILYLKAFKSNSIENKNSDILDWQTVNWIFIPLGLLLYPMALGLTTFDSYSLGYNQGFLIALVVLLAATFLYKQKLVMTLTFSSVLLAYSVNIMESTNLWDYLIDPLLFLFLIIRLVIGFLLRLFRSNKPKLKHNATL